MEVGETMSVGGVWRALRFYSTSGSDPVLYDFPYIPRLSVYER